MAYSPELWLKARGYYEAGLSLAEIKEKTGIDRSVISKRAKMQQWQQGSRKGYVEAKEEIATVNATVNATPGGHIIMNALNEIADDNIRRKNLVFGTLERSVKKMDELLQEGIIYDKVGIGDGIQRFEPRRMNPKEAKELIEGVAKAGESLGVVEREKSISVTNIQAQQQKIETTELPEFNILRSLALENASRIYAEQRHASMQVVIETEES